MNADTLNVDTEKLLQIAHEHSPDGITILRPVRDAQGAVVDFTWLYQNKTVARMNGTAANSVIGKRLLDLFPGHTGTIFMEKYIHVAETGTTCIFEEAYEGESIPSKTWFRIVVVPADGDIAIMAQDITQQKELESNLTEALAEAKRANLAKSEFLASMSHDFRTPLNAMMGFTDMMRQRAFGPLNNEHYEEYIEDIHSSGSLLVSLVNDVLDLSKIEAGNYKLIEESVSLSALVQTCVRQNTTQARLKTINLVEEIPDGFPHLLGDERALVQICNNLISNAVRHTPNSGMVSISANLRQDQSIILRIVDTGSGMTPDELEDALNPFEPDKSKISRPNKQTGLGLTICNHLMDLFGGKMSINSTPDKGTSVWLRFPADRTLVAAG
ncbi:PAS domain-containing sensor histidine kinase [Magnetovibrio sp. PR-2]|uniref:sensor histidine kinase n=1 Tax=Magnetovibrio sp. PR-2 TaxID=3120356 RepID=UPI002FCE0725